MNADEFFTKVDAKIRKEAGADAASKKTASGNRELLEQIIARLTPLAASYEAKLKERGINIEVEGRPTGISIAMRYKDGSRDELHIGGISKSSLIELKASLIEDGQRYTTTKTCDYGEWQDSIFEARLQKLIESFLLYADKHGGI